MNSAIFSQASLAATVLEDSAAPGNNAADDGDQPGAADFRCNARAALSRSTITGGSPSCKTRNRCWCRVAREPQAKRDQFSRRGVYRGAVCE